MTSPSTYLSLSALMFVAGVCIPIMAALNAGLGARIGSPWAAGFMLFVVGALVCAAVMLANGGLPKQAFGAPIMYYAGGALVSVYILGVTYSAPRIGVGNAIFFVLLGQIVAACTIDHFGLFGAPRSPITLQRVAGVALMLGGVFLARRVA